jgi:thiamine-monophosphate kinase
VAARSEFTLIRQFFSALGATRADVVLGVGDDAALVDSGGADLLVLCVDTLTAGVHFPADAPADAVGHKALAVNLSDLAAMGARPAWALLSLTLPAVDADWLTGFRSGFHRLAAAHDIALIGGDTTRGELAASVTLAGFVERDGALRRDGAHPGDAVYVSGALGDAAVGLRYWQAGRRSESEAVAAAIERLHRPLPRVALGRALVGLASATIDISDGLAADLGHILERSGVGAVVEIARLPLSPSLRSLCSQAEAAVFALTGGDDYELCFTAPPAREPDLTRAAAALGVAVTRIGTIEPEPGLRLVDDNGRALPLPRAGYDHFGGGR